MENKSTFLSLKMVLLYSAILVITVFFLAPNEKHRPPTPEELKRYEEEDSAKFRAIRGDSSVEVYVIPDSAIKKDSLQ